MNPLAKDIPVVIIAIENQLRGGLLFIYRWDQQLHKRHNTTLWFTKYHTNVPGWIYSKKWRRRPTHTRSHTGKWAYKGRWWRGSKPDTGSSGCVGTLPTPGGQTSPHILWYFFPPPHTFLINFCRKACMDVDQWDQLQKVFRMSWRSLQREERIQSTDWS